LLAPVVFVGTFLVEGWLRPGYDPRSMFVSELAIGPRGWVQDVNFFVSGALFLLFAWAMAAGLHEGKASRAGPILLTIIGIGLFASAFFVTDPSTTPRDEVTVSGRIHSLFGALVFALSPVSCFVFLRRFLADPMWRSLWPWTLAAGVITTVAVVLMAVGPAQPPAPPNAFNAWQGAIQRTFLITYMVWVFLVALRLRNRSA